MRKIRGVIGMNNALVFEKLQWRPIAQCLMGSNAIICVLPVAKFFIQLRDSPRTIIDLIEFLCMGSLCSLNASIEL